MRIAIGSDHHGLDRKGTIIAALEASGHMVLDLGASSTEPVDYPDCARKVGQAVLRDFVEAGVLVCGSGVGAAIAANKIRGIRAAPCADAAAALESRQQIDANVLCLSANALDDGAADRGHAHLDRREVFRGRGPCTPGRQARPARGRTGRSARCRARRLHRLSRGERRRAPPRPRTPRRYPPHRRPRQRDPTPRPRLPPRPSRPRLRSSPPPQRCGRRPPRSPSRAMPSSTPWPRRPSPSSSRTTSSIASG